jgi:hypothetical protein
MKKIELLIVAAALAISTLAFAEDKAGTANHPADNPPAQETQHIILYRAALIGASCALYEATTGPQTTDDTGKTSANTTKKEQARIRTDRINKCIEDGIAQMEAAMAASP